MPDKPKGPRILPPGNPVSVNELTAGKYLSAVMRKAQPQRVIAFVVGQDAGDAILFPADRAAAEEGDWLFRPVGIDAYGLTDLYDITESVQFDFDLEAVPPDSHSPTGDIVAIEGSCLLACRSGQSNRVFFDLATGLPSTGANTGTLARFSKWTLRVPKSEDADFFAFEHG